MEIDFLLLDMMFFVDGKCCLCFIYWYSILIFMFVGTCVYCFLSNMFAIIFPFLSSITTFVTVPMAPFVNPSFTSIFVVIITFALTFTVRIFFKLPVSCGFVGIVIFAISVQSSFLLSVAIFVNSFPGSNFNLYVFHSSQ